MEYDEIIKHSEPSLNIKQRFYEVYIQPYLRRRPNPDNLAYLLDQAWDAWRLGVKKNDIKKVLFVKWMCKELKKNNENDFVLLMSRLLQDTHDTMIRSETAERNVYNAKISRNTERIFRDSIEQYKVFFENEFRLWATVPYYYVCKNYGLKNNGSTPGSYVSIGASEKFHALKNIQTLLLKGNPRDLIIGFDNEIRNAGAGHESWEITDKNTILLKIIDPKTGYPKGSEQIELSKNQLEDLLKQCRKTIWILRMGVSLFLNNNPNFVAKLGRSKNFKIKEIEGHLAQFAANRWFTVKDFIVDDERTKIQLDLQYTPKIIGDKGQVFFGNGEKYDLIKIEERVKYKYQILGILQYLLVSFFERNKLPVIDLKIRNEKEQLIAELEYQPNELQKLFLEKTEENIPVSSRGEIPDSEYLLAYEVRVPFGQREVFEKFLNLRKKK